MNIDKYKKINIGLFLIFATVTIGIWTYWEQVCAVGDCNRNIREFILRPLLWGAIPLSLILGSTLAFQGQYFQKWLLHIASWSLPVSLYFVLEQDPRNYGPFGIGREDLAWIFGTVIFFLTILHAVIWHIVEIRKGRLPARESYRLAVFLVTGSIFYTLWQLF